MKEFLTNFDGNLAQLLIVSQLEIKEGEAPKVAHQFEDLAVLVEKAEGQVCDRCRAVKEDVGSHEALPTLCDRCREIVEKEFSEAVLRRI